MTEFAGVRVQGTKGLGLAPFSGIFADEAAGPTKSLVQARSELQYIVAELQGILDGEFDGTDAEWAKYDAEGGDDAVLQVLVHRLDAITCRI